MPTKEELDRLEALLKRERDAHTALQEFNNETGPLDETKYEQLQRTSTQTTRMVQIAFGEQAESLIQAARRAEALEACALKYLDWLNVESPKEGLESDLRDVEMCGDKTLKEST